MATNLTSDQTKEHKVWHQKYRDYHCENCHQGRTIFREEAGKKEILVDQRHKQREAEALKNLEEIERSIRDKEEEEAPATTATVHMSEDALDAFEVQTVRNGKIETATAKDIKETTTMDNSTKNNSTDDNATKIELDFSDHQDLFELIVARAKIEFRTINQQVLYMVNQQIRHEGELEET